MRELGLKYGVNPNQGDAKVSIEQGELPFTVLSGRVGYINLLDALNSWQLVDELARATALPAAASFKHVSPAGAAVGLPLDERLAKAYMTSVKGLSPLACAYARARGADRMSSFGDFAAMSETVDIPTARLLSREVSDGVIAPGYEPEALEILKSKRGGQYCIVQIDSAYQPDPVEKKTLFGVTIQQRRNDMSIDGRLFENIVSRNKELPEDAKRDLLVSLITLKYTQSNSVCYAINGQAIGIGAGQQSRIHCTRLAGMKADIWHLRQHPALLELEFLPEAKRPERDNIVDQLLQDDAEETFQNDVAWNSVLARRPHVLTRAEKRRWIAGLDGVALGSDAFFPFGDNIERAHKSGVRYVAEAGGSIRDDDVIAACDRHGIVLAMIGIRLFHH